MIGNIDCGDRYIDPGNRFIDPGDRYIDPGDRLLQTVVIRFMQTLVTRCNRPL